MTAQRILKATSVMAYTVTLAFRRLRQEGQYGFKASLDYIVRREW